MTVEVVSGELLSTDVVAKVALAVVQLNGPFTMQQVLDLTGIQSRSTAWRAVQVLASEGLVVQAKRGSRSIYMTARMVARWP